MVMSNRELTTIARQAKAQEDLTKAMTSGAYVKEIGDATKKNEASLKALQKAKGGARLLDAAEKTAAEIIATGERQAAVTTADADGLIAIRNAGLDKRSGELDTLAANVARGKDANVTHAETLEARQKTLKKIGDEQTVKAGDLERLSRSVTERETKVTERERKQTEYERWRGQAPAA